MSSALFFLFEKLNRTVNGPIRPININNIITIFPRKDKVGVKFAVTPTVHTAEIVSNKVYKSGASGSVKLSKNTLVRISVVNTIKIVKAFLAISCEILWCLN